MGEVFGVKPPEKKVYSLMFFGWNYLTKLLLENAIVFVFCALMLSGQISFL